MNDNRFANKIRQALNEGAKLGGQRGAIVAERLRAARERALAQKRLERAPALGWVPMQSSGALGGFGRFSLRVLLPALLLAVGLASIYSWQNEQRAADIVELDSRLLSDDLPIDAYLDRGFEAWLKKVSAN